MNLPAASPKRWPAQEASLAGDALVQPRSVPPPSPNRPAGLWGGPQHRSCRFGQVAARTENFRRRDRLAACASGPGPWRRSLNRLCNHLPRPFRRQLATDCCRYRKPVANTL
ncbi:hypothetical protein A9A59_0288 [Tepidiforma thermophila]|uniref:Uncharacterized protein n=1 Tax=Tepidiforma thermophila (strain KCTC 52669 / CGMCC 1.13589 / G233) TaxID=2761530 RepID=A0A2A9HDK1_TEPT2|nr:hypothetical protein A9A59_0288 [Tepidiforma thermophila]